jgi:glucose/arabinose dehydrogenase
MRRLATLRLALCGAALAGTALAAAPRPGDRFEVRLADLPQPYASESSSNASASAARPDDLAPSVPPGFTASLYADGLERPRALLVLPDGSVLVSEPSRGAVLRLVDREGDGRADAAERFVDGLSAPYGLALREDEVLVADHAGIWSVPYGRGAARSGVAARMITAAGAFGPEGGHSSRSLVIGNDGRLYVGIGSMSNLDETPPPRASVQVFEADGSGGRTFASGLRNPVGIAVRPGTDELWTVVNERDGMGDRLVPDYLARLEDGAFYGWPYAYLGPDRPQPDFAERRPDLVAATRTPDLLFEAHSAPLDLVFHDGRGFGADYAGDAFVTLHGSWNRADPTGYMVVRVPFDGAGRPEGGYEAFVTGFRLDRGAPGEAAAVWGRPAGVAEMPDGALLVSDDVGGTIWRISRTD